MVELFFRVNVFMRVFVYVCVIILCFNLFRPIYFYVFSVKKAIV